MLKQKECLLGWIIMLFCLLVACGKGSHEYAPDTLMEVVSTVQLDDCFICGSWDYNPMLNYDGKDSIGIVYWNEPTIRDTGVRIYDGAGNEIIGIEAMQTGGAHFEDPYGEIAIYSLPDNGISEITASYSEADTVDLDALSGTLCQTCLDKVVGFYTAQHDKGNDNKLGTTGFCLIDLKTRELYTLSEPSRGYSIRDYFVRFSFQEKLDKSGRVTSSGQIQALVFYAPVRTA